MSDTNDLMQLETTILEVIKTIYDPEIPVNIYDLGLIYNIDIDDDNNVTIEMTLTAPNCPVADSILAEVTDKVNFISAVNETTVNLVFEPTWTKEMMSEEAQLELGFL